MKLLPALASFAALSTLGACATQTPPLAPMHDADMRPMDRADMMAKKKLWLSIILI